MSDVVEKTLASIPKFLGGGLLGAGQPSSPKHASVRGFSSFLRQTQKARSKHEEEHIVRHEIVEMQQKLALRDTTKQQTCDCLCRAIFCELLGYDLSSVYIYAVKLAQQGTGFEKRLGYLACSLLLNENHELILLLINTIQKDLNSSNILDNCAALTVICQLVNSEMIPSVLPLVQEKLKHPRELVRMKAAMCVHKFLLKTPSMVDHFQDQFQKILFDKDPGVMSVGVKIYSLLIQSPDRCHSDKLTENLIGILNQVVHNRLPSEFEFHNVPMPWLQMDVLRTLAKLGTGNKQQSELMYPVLKDVIKRLDMKERIAYAILYECIVTISAIYPNKDLQREATTCVSRFIGSTNPSLKYIGIKALTALVKSCPESALEHQMTVVELLNDKDQAIQRKTLDLLYCMANPSNVQVVCDRLLHHVKNNTTNTFLQLDLATKVIHLADNFASSDQWYVDTVYMLLSLCKVTLPRELVDKVIFVIEKGCETDNKNGDKSPESKEFQQYLLKKSLGTLFQDNISPQLILVSVWILGECGNLLKNMPSEKVVTLVLKHFQKQTLDVSTKLWMTSSLTKLVCAKVLDRDVVTERLAEARDKEKDSIVRQKLTDTLNIVKSQIDLPLPTISSSNAKQLDRMDFTLSFLDDYVSQSLIKGAQPYKAKTLWYQPPQPNSELFCGLNGVTNDNTEGVTKENMSQGSSVSGKLTGGSEGGSDLSGGQRETGLNMQGVKRVWGRKGLISEPQSDTAMSSSSSPPQREDNQDIPASLGGLESEMEDDRGKKIVLASALFSGITNKQNSRMEGQEGSVRVSTSPIDSRSQGSEDSYSSSAVSPKPLPTQDTGGWRSLHNKSTTETPVTENTLSSSNDIERIPLNTKTEEKTVDQNVLRGFCDGADSSVSNLSINVADLSTDLTASLYAEGQDDLLSDISMTEPPHYWGHALHRDPSSYTIDDRPCLPGSTSAHSLYDVLSPENGNRQFVAMETQNEKQVIDGNTTETLYDDYSDQT